jgi:lipopolysaccharide assembly outer membrane protein LptD (OstA)
VPSFFFSKSRGVTFEDLGVYLALSDYYDTQILTDIYSKGGYTLKNKKRWVLEGRILGKFGLQYGKTRFDPMMIIRLIGAWLSTTTNR